MKIYTLTQTRLHDATAIWHFPTKKQAQQKMVGLCNGIIGQNVCGINTSVNIDGWDYQSGDNYAVLSDGNRWEFDIFEKEVDLVEFTMQAIADRFAERYPNAAPYRECFYNSVKSLYDSLEDNCLPRLTDKDIDYFIDVNMFDFLMDRAADAVCEGYEGDDKALSSCFEYLSCNYEPELMLRIFGGELAAVDEVQNGVNEMFGEKIFSEGGFVWVAESFITGGACYAPMVETCVFSNLDSAKRFMDKEMTNMYGNFKSVYDDGILTTEKSDDGLEYNVTAYNECCCDAWVGTISRKRVED